jgi:hypothetical protein
MLRLHPKLFGMKYSILFFSLLFSITVSAQFQKGNKVLGLGLSFGSNSSENFNGNTTLTNRSSGLNISTELGFAKNQTTLNGFFLNAGVGSQKFESTQAPSTKSTSYTAGAGYFMRKYKPLGKSFFVFGDLRGGFNYSHQNSNQNQQFDQTGYNISASLFPGVAYQWNRKFLLEIRMGDLISTGYNKNIQKNSSTSERVENSSFGFSSSLGLGYFQNLGIGIRWIVGKKA